MLVTSRITPCCFSNPVPGNVFNFALVQIFGKSVSLALDREGYLKSNKSVRVRIRAVLQNMSGVLTVLRKHMRPTFFNSNRETGSQSCH